MGMNRRDFLTLAAGAGAVATLPAPAIAKESETRVLRFVPQANLPNLDPVWGTQYVVRNASLLVYDTLFGLSSNLEPKPQMCAGYETSADGRVWTFRLRDGLYFHDKEPVRSVDVVASLKRWMARDAMGQVLKDRLDALEVVNDKQFRVQLQKPFPKLLLALAKPMPNIAVVMPERIANSDPFKQVAEYIGSGPMRFRRDEWVPGSRAVFERFSDYVPREETGDWLAGGKRMELDRIEWQVIPDAATAAAALQSGEVDWWETPIADLVPLLRANGKLRVEIADNLGNIGILRFNHLYPPFNDVRVRRAVAMVVSQDDYMHAVVGSDDALWRPMPSIFTPGTPLYTEAGGEILKGPRHWEEAKRLLAEAGYNGEKIVMLVATDIGITKGQSDVTADLLKRLGMNVDYVATDWGTVGARRAKQDPPSAGGWHIFHTWLAGLDCTTPATNIALRANGRKAWFGWPSSELIQTLIGQWYDAPDLAAERWVAADLNKAAMDFLPYIPTGFFLAYQAWRNNVSGIVKAPFPVFWGVRKQ